MRADSFFPLSQHPALGAGCSYTALYQGQRCLLYTSPVRLMDAAGLLFGSKTRLGARPTDSIDLYWPQGEEAILYARVDWKTK